MSEASPLVGQTCRDAELGRRFAVNVLGILRGDEHLTESIDRVGLRPGDVLIVQAQIDDLMRLRHELAVSLLPDVKLSRRELTAESLVTAEILVTPRSSLVGHSLMEVDSRRRFGGFVMAIRRHSLTLREKVAHAVLGPWDVLLNSPTLSWRCSASPLRS